VGGIISWSKLDWKKKFKHLTRGGLVGALDWSTPAERGCESYSLARFSCMPLLSSLGFFGGDTTDTHGPPRSVEAPQSKESLPKQGVLAQSTPTHGILIPEQVCHRPSGHTDASVLARLAALPSVRRALPACAAPSLGQRCSAKPPAPLAERSLHELLQPLEGGRLARRQHQGQGQGCGARCRIDLRAPIAAGDGGRRHLQGPRRRRGATRTQVRAARRQTSLGSSLLPSGHATTTSTPTSTSSTECVCVPPCVPPCAHPLRAGPTCASTPTSASCTNTRTATCAP
jgi:hypothetical protein